MNRVTCIVKREHHNPHERILRLGGDNGSGGYWENSEQEVINMIKSGKYDFYVRVNGRAVNVIIATHERREYLKTVADGYEPNNLLSLGNCPTR